MSLAWRSELSFQERLSKVTQIIEAYQAASPDKNASVFRLEAKKAENEAYQCANSKAAYNGRCEDLIGREKSVTAVRNDGLDLTRAKTTIELPDLSGKPTRKLGPYDECVHHYSGLFSSIYLAHSSIDPSQILAIKVTSPGSESLPHNSKREARLLRETVHENVISLIATHQMPNSSNFLLVFPYQPLTLAERLLLATAVPKRVLHDIFSALDFIHVKGIIHRDIKPTNILLSGVSGPALLADFGLAWSPNDPASEPADAKITDVGTTCYRPPELLFGYRSYDAAVDLWAAGCLVAEVFMHNTSLAGDGEWTLFDAGELGSELALVKSIFETLATPDEHTWPESKDLPDWGKMTFVDFPAKPWEEILPRVPREEVEIVRGLVQYESGWRTRPTEVQSQLSSLSDHE